VEHDFVAIAFNERKGERKPGQECGRRRSDLQTMFWRKGKDGTGTGSGGTGLKQQQQHLVPARQLVSFLLFFLRGATILSERSHCVEVCWDG